MTPRTHNISLTDPHKVPRRHHEPAHVPSSREQPQGSTKGSSSRDSSSPASSHQTTFPEHPLIKQRRQKDLPKGRFAKTASAKKRPSKAACFLSSSLRSSKRLQIALTCLVSAIVLLGVLGIVNACTNSTLESGSSGEAALNTNSSQNVMSQKLSGIAHEIATISHTINNIQAKGYHIGFSTQSLQAGATLGFEENRLFYSASSIKGPYILAALENRGSIPSSQRDNIEAAIVDSDNDAYFRLVQSFGIDPINAELASVGATDRLNSNDYFVHITPRHLCGLWKISASFLESPTDDNAWLQTLFAQTLNSEIAKIEGAKTWSKAGWIVDEDESYNATVDAGIVVRGNLTYAMAVMCDKGEDFDAIAPLVKSLDALEQYFG